MIQYDNLYLYPSIEFMQSDSLSKNRMEFGELDEDTWEIIVRSLVRDKVEIIEI